MVKELEEARQALGFAGPDIPRDEDMYRCVHCGLCLSSCPTYGVLDLETESPRGRIALMKAVREGRLSITHRVAAHWELCLQCRACEAVCPSGVPFGRMMEHTRAQLLQSGQSSRRLRIAKALFLRGALPHLGRLRFAMALLRLYQRSGLQWLARRSRILKVLPGHLDELDAQLPPLPSRFFGPTPQVYPAKGKARARVALLSGCVMPLMQAPAMEATVRVLQRNGCHVLVPVGQGCCGALNAHSGDLEMARRMARRNIDVFLSAGVDTIVVNSAGCGSAMKEYAELLCDDPQYAEKAHRFSSIVKDVTEFLADLPLDPPRARLEMKVTYQDPCHLAHAQRISKPPRVLLRAIPGLELVEMRDPTRCCGAAGIYSVLQKKMSRQLLENKMKDVASTGVRVVATANPGCMMQLQLGWYLSGVDGQVYHVVELLDKAYQAEA